MRKLIISILIAGMLIFGMSMGVMAAGEATSDSAALAITISEVAQINADNADATFTINDGVSPGAAPTVAESTSGQTLEYTSIVASGEARKITVSLDSEVSGCCLKIVAVATGDGTIGSNAGQFEITSAEGDLITTIGSCSSGNPGATITYALTIDNLANVKADGTDTNDRTITFTITAGS